MAKIKEKLKLYRRSVPIILLYQVITKAIIAVILLGLERLFTLLLKSGGRVAVSSGDIKFLFTTWQGILILVLFFVVLFVYFAFDLNAMIIFSSKLLNGEKRIMWSSIKEGFFSIKRFFCPRGIGIILYITFVVPLAGVGIGVSLTENFYIPNFITSVIHSKPLFSILYYAGIIALAIFGLLNIFVVHGTVLDKLSVKESGQRSGQLIKKNIKNYIKEVLIHTLIIAAIFAVAILVFAILIGIINVLPFAQGVSRGLIVCLSVIAAIVIGCIALLVVPFELMKITELYYTYRDGKHFEVKKREGRKFTAAKVILISIVLVLAIVLSIIGSLYFDEIFPNTFNVGVVAHRAGGNEAPENTVKGIETAYSLGAMGSEIDIQRTSDGYYVVNHDSNFSRVAGVDKAPEEMTLAEVKELSVDGEPVATFEDMLDASKGKVILFTELKGNTADKQMADDAVKIVKERNMTDEVVFISLQYDIIDYIETNYPEMQTGYLIWLSFGDVSALNCDYIALEEESVSEETIYAIHDQNKKVLVWTANDEDSQKKLFLGSADGMITDNIKQANEVREALEKRSDLKRILDLVFN